VADWGDGVSASCNVGPVRYSAGNGWPHNALRHHWLMPISCHFRDCKVLQVMSLTHVSGVIMPRPLPLALTVAGIWFGPTSDNSGLSKRIKVDIAGKRITL